MAVALEGKPFSGLPLSVNRPPTARRTLRVRAQQVRASQQAPPIPPPSSPCGDGDHTEVLDRTSTSETSTSGTFGMQQMVTPALPSNSNGGGNWSYLRINNVLSLTSSLTSFVRTKPRPVQSTDTKAPEHDTLVVVPPSPSGAAAAPPRQRSFVLRFKRVPAEKTVEEPHHPTHSNHAVLQLLRQRAAAGSRPGARTDRFKLGLVVEGGGMRGAVTGGALMALLELNMRGCFDAVYGSSAGAINATYFLTGQPEGVNIYAEDISNRDFCDLSRLYRGPGPVLDIDFLLSHVMAEVKPLDWEGVLRSDVPLKVVASSLDALRPVLLEGFANADDLRLCLKASANIPEIVGGPLLHRGQRLVDAAVFEPIPFRAAIADGCTHVLALCSRPRTSRGLGSAVGDLLDKAVKRAVLSPEYMRPAWQRELEVLAAEGLSHDDQLALGLSPGHHELSYFRGAHVCPVFPGLAAGYAPVCIQPEVLRGGVSAGRDAVFKALTPFAQSVGEGLLLA